MYSSEIDITCILTTHGEGLMIGQSYRSMMEAVAYAEQNDLKCEVLIAMDNPTEATSVFVSALAEEHELRLETFNFADQGLVRNEMVALANGKYVAFLDGDDFWSFNWLAEAYQLARVSPLYIVHPEFNSFFGGSKNLLVKVDQRDHNYNQEFLLSANYWDALCFALKDIYLSCPYNVRDVRGGYAYEDWVWNCETIQQGYVHVVAKDTVHFKRRRAGSQTMEASAKKVLGKRTKLFELEPIVGGG